MQCSPCTSRGSAPNIFPKKIKYLLVCLNHLINHIIRKPRIERCDTLAFKLRAQAGNLARIWIVCDQRLNHSPLFFAQHKQVCNGRFQSVGPGQCVVTVSQTAPARYVRWLTLYNPLRLAAGKIVDYEIGDTLTGAVLSAARGSQSLSLRKAPMNLCFAKSWTGSVLGFKQYFHRVRSDQ